jgi:hypothetical protein
MKVHYVGLLSRSWVCHGPEGRSTCEKRSGDAVRAHFADALEDPEWAMERIANRWARVFASTRSWARCSGHMTQPLCERIACESLGGFKIPNCTPPTTAYRRSFGKVRVEEIAIRGERVAARFSNGELITLVGVVGGDWLVHKVGGNAGRKVFE